VRGDLPPEAEVPTINVESADSQFASAYLSFTSDILQQNQITDYLVRAVQPRLSAIAGVQRADILGARTFAMRIWLKPDRMAAFNISPLEVRRALGGQQLHRSGGQTKGSLVQVNLTANTDLPRWRIQTPGRAPTGGALVRLEDIADVVLGSENYDTESAFPARQPSLWAFGPAQCQFLDVIKAGPQRDGGYPAELPSGLDGRIAYDATNYIDNAIREVTYTLVLTLAIVALIIFLFLGSLRSAFIPMLAIPLSLIGGFFLMQVFGFSINLLTLLAIVLAVGLVVDDAIVMVENVERHLGMGKSPLEAALTGARELVGPIIATTVVPGGGYTPIGMQGGLTGSLFREFAFTLTGAVIISTVVALTLSPMMSSKLLAPGMSERGFAGKIARDFKRLHRFLRPAAECHP
jgi:multidrug efflux pump